MSSHILGYLRETCFEHLDAGHQLYRKIASLYGRTALCTLLKTDLRIVTEAKLRPFVDALLMLRYLLSNMDTHLDGWSLNFWPKLVININKISMHFGDRG